MPANFLISPHHLIISRPRVHLPPLGVHSVAVGTHYDEVTSDTKFFSRDPTFVPSVRADIGDESGDEASDGQQRISCQF